MRAPTEGAYIAAVPLALVRSRGYGTPGGFGYQALYGLYKGQGYMGPIRALSVCCENYVQLHVANPEIHQ